MTDLWHRGSVRLYAEFYDSDIIVASPLALASLLKEGKEGAADFLASIEIALLDRCDVMQMQNWSHVHTGAAMVASKCSAASIRHARSIHADVNQVQYCCCCCCC